MFSKATEEPMVVRLCGAKARSNGGKPCGQLALRNGRCRFHGGLSTGPKTAEGKARCIAATTKHGRRSKESIERHRAIMKRIKEAKAFLQSLDRL